VRERERERKRREELRAGELTQHCLTLETVSSTNHPTASYTHKHTEREREREREREPPSYLHPNSARSQELLLIFHQEQCLYF